MGPIEATSYEIIPISEVRRIKVWYVPNGDPSSIFDEMQFANQTRKFDKREKFCIKSRKTKQCQ
jgi:hypothetical protein